MELPQDKSICLPFASQEEYGRLVKNENLPELRAYLNEVCERHPELFPHGFEQGFFFHDQRCSKKLGLIVRRVKLKATGAVYSIRPSLMMPFAIGWTDDLEKALYLRQWNVPFEALAHVFGRDAGYYERALRSLGRPSLVATTVKSAQKLPTDLLADEKHTRLQGHKAYVTTVVAKGCFLGAAVVREADEPSLRQGYGEFAQEARQVDEHYTPRSVCLDGWQPCHRAWRLLFSKVTIIACFLHAALKVSRTCLKRVVGLRNRVMERVWHVYHAPSKASFAQRIRRLREWCEHSLPADKTREAVLKLCDKYREFLGFYELGGGYRTSNMLDRLMNYQDRVLYASRYLHGELATARLTVRAQALLWNFHPYSVRWRREYGVRGSPFEQLNGFTYHHNWLHNLLIAASMGGLRR